MSSPDLLCCSSLSFISSWLCRRRVTRYLPDSKSKNSWYISVAMTPWFCLLTYPMLFMYSQYVPSHYAPFPLRPLYRFPITSPSHYVPFPLRPHPITSPTNFFPLRPLPITSPTNFFPLRPLPITSPINFFPLRPPYQFSYHLLIWCIWCSIRITK